MSVTVASPACLDADKIWEVIFKIQEEKQNMKRGNGMMRAAIIHGARDIRLERVDTPSIQGNEILVKVKVCGICGSDVHVYKTGAMLAFQKPTILGHEFSGEIVEVGSAVKGLRVGDKVLGTGVRACGRCRWCQQGYLEGCPDFAIPGYGLDGAFTEYVVVPNPGLGKTLFKIPEVLSWEEAATIEPVSVSCFAVEQALIQPNDTVVVMGAGMIGQGVAQVAKAKGAAKVIVSEPSSKRLAMAEKLGVDVAFNPRETDVVNAVKELTSQGMADVVFECSGSPAAFRQALQMTRPFGKAIQVGVFEESIDLSTDLISYMTFRNITLRGCAGQSWATALLWRCPSSLWAESRERRKRDRSRFS